MVGLPVRLFVYSHAFSLACCLVFLPILDVLCGGTWLVWAPEIGYVDVEQERGASAEFCLTGCRNGSGCALVDRGLKQADRRLCLLLEVFGT